MAKLWEFWQGRPKPVFSKKVQGGEQEEFFKTRPKSTKSYGNSRKVTQKPHFLKKCKGETKENFSKIAKKVALPSKTQKHSGANGIILFLVCIYSAKTGEDFGAKSGSKRARMARLWQFRQGHPKPAFF